LIFLRKKQNSIKILVHSKNLEYKFIVSHNSTVVAKFYKFNFLKF
jgi:hypothetical protein